MLVWCSFMKVFKTVKFGLCHFAIFPHSINFFFGFFAKKSEIACFKSANASGLLTHCIILRMSICASFNTVAAICFLY